MAKKIVKTTHKMPVKKSSIKTEWDFSGLFSSTSDPKIEKEIKSIENACEAFAKKYKNEQGYMESIESLAFAMRDFEKLQMITSTCKAGWYFSMLLAKNTDDHKTQAALNILESRVTKALNNVLFFELNLGKIGKNFQKDILASEKLGPYKYFLERTFITSKYNLSESEEKILSLKRQPSYSMWVDAQEKLISSKTVKWQGKVIPLSQAIGLITTLPTKARYKLRELITEKLMEAPNLPEAELNAIVTNKKIDDELRGAKSPYELTVVGYQNDMDSVESLVEVVTKNFHISHRFYRLKAKLLKLKKLRVADTAVGVGQTTAKVSFEKASEIINESFGQANLRFSQIFEDMLKHGMIDVYPKKGKRGGAFCNSGFGVPTMVLLNHIDNLDSLMTLAHEMGHAIHAEYSKIQPVLYEGHTISVAEVASTFFENLAFEKVFSTLSDKDKKIALFDRIQDDISTIFRQIAFFNFEKEMHESIRAKGALSHEEFAELFAKHLKSYIGPIMDIKATDGYTFTYIPHIRYFFYVYSYAYGQIISKALYGKYKEDPSFIKKIEEFLSAGGSKSPYDIFMDIGIDTSDPEFFKAGLKSIEADIEKLEKLTK